ncbi:sensor histidine kinase [Vagococcus salmoninarum]|uniref:sensor histidine kinase n=1 Tax=Vagococcus salmoninarum TaxID=2739 RepID=UPI00187E185D|nr:histidine kinase [Vagococcus salmoninarum]MBE9389419.1 sensor histidine kinase [Vagococcus salmoninarum]
MKKQLNLIDTLLRTYAVVMILIITLFTFLVGYSTFQQFARDANRENEQTARLLTETLTNAENQASQIVHELASKKEDISNLQEYFDQDHQSYLETTLKRQGDQRYWPQMISQLYQQQKDIGGIGASLNSYDQVFYSDKVKKGGMKLKKFPKNTNQLMISRPIIEAESLQHSGVFYFFIDQDKIASLLEDNNSTRNQEVMIFSATNQPIYHYRGSGKTNSEGGLLVNQDLQTAQKLKDEKIFKKYYTTEVKTSGELSIVTLTSKKAVYQEAFSNYAWILIGSLLLDGILLVILFRTFGGYSKQVEDVLESMHLVAEGDLDVRITEENKRREIKEIATGVNQMLDSINQYVKDIYLLEIKQQDAHMKALQSQINPHFLYNTLEYIRMYAVSEGVNELADVVYAFASLLRNNTTQEKVVSLNKELEFCEKYVYLYQMRYPDRVAYHFTIAEELFDVMIPKFLIQPVVENYFVHGIDFTRFDNALSVKVYQEQGRVVIDVIDNGRGLTDQQLITLNQELAKQELGKELGHSVGLANVQQRLKLVFGESSQMRVFHSEAKGLVVRLSFEEGQDGL